MFEVFEHFPKWRKCFGVVGVFCIIHRYVVFDSIWEHGSNKCDFFNLKNPRSVKNFRTKELFGILEDVGS